MYSAENPALIKNSQLLELLCEMLLKQKHNETRVQEAGLKVNLGSTFQASSTFFLLHAIQPSNAYGTWMINELIELGILFWGGGGK